VRFYDTNDYWSHDPNADFITLSQQAIGIALDLSNQYVYTGTAWVDPYPTYYLSQYDLSADPNTAETLIDVGAEIIGIAVDQQTSLIYITTYGGSGDYIRPYPMDRLFVFDANLTEQWVSDDDIGNPAGVAVAGDVSYKEPFPTLTLVKEDNVADCVEPEDVITYTITYSANGDSDSNVVITDYLPIEVEPNNPFDPNYDYYLHRYTWDIGTLSPGDSNSVTLEVVVNNLAEPLGKIINYFEIEGDQYCSFATADTNVCCWGGDIIYVDKSTIYGFNIGTSWENAYLDLQDALERAMAGCGNQIWVAKGTYKPTDGDDRSISFEMVGGVSIYGGFPPGGGQRNPAIYQTILSGDISNQSETDDNSYHVVTCENVNKAILDGFTIIAGNADASDGPNCRGGGIHNYNSSLTIKNCIFRGNSASTGGGICNDDSSDPNITNCIFIDNTASGYGGGGMYNRINSSPIVANCIFCGNQVTKYDGGGGGVGNYDMSSPTLINCTFVGNSAMGYAGTGGGMDNYDNCSPIVTNCIFWANYAEDSNNEINNAISSNPTVSYCDIQGDTIYSGTGNRNTDPCFVDADANNYHLDVNSFCIDAGDPYFNPNPPETDIDGESRIVNGRVDMGADEYYWSPADFNKDEIVNFIDYAMLANAWQSSSGQPDYNDIFDLADNNSIDYNDLALFCDDWLWEAGWNRTMESMMMGLGMNQSMSESASLTEVVYSPAEVEQKQSEQINQLDIEEMLKWLAEVWLDPEVQETIDEADWLKFIESLKSDLE